MRNFCIPREYAPRLRRQFERDGLNVSDLYDKTSTERREFFEKTFDPETARQVNALFEKAMLSNQTAALKNWVWKHLYGSTPLYEGLSLEDSQTLRNNLSMVDLQRLKPEQRLAELQKHLDGPIAKKLAESYERLRKTGNLGQWEKRVFATDQLLADKKLKGAFARLEALNDLGVLKPDQLEKFMEDFVSDKLGINVSAEEAAEISRKTTAVTNAYDKVDGDWTADNGENVRDYFRKRKDLETYLNRLDPESAVKVFLDIGARGSMLFSVRSFVNNFLYQWFPVSARAITKRLTEGVMTPGDYSALGKVSAAWASTASGLFDSLTWKQIKLGIQIYKETGYDLSRMSSLDEGFKYFGEKFTHTEGPTFKEAEGISEKLSTIVRGHAKLMEPGLKWMAGGPDTFFANFHRADTTALLARTIAKAEENTGNLPEGKTYDDRVKELFKDAYRPDPQTEQGQYIREMGVGDAHHSAYTNNSWAAETAVRLRDAIPFSAGKALVPFLKIPATAFAASIEMTTGIGVARGAYQVISAIPQPASVEKNAQIANGISTSLTMGGGLALAAIIATAFFDDDDYIPAWDDLKQNEKGLTRTKNGGGSYIRIDGNWFSTRWLGPLAIPFSAIMESRIAKSKGQDVVRGYFNGMVSGLREFPAIKEIADTFEDVTDKARKAKDWSGVGKAIGIDPANASKWIASRTLTSTIQNDLLGTAINTPRYDALGRKMPHKSDSIGAFVTSLLIGANVKEDTSNEITKEFDRLNLKGYLPTLTEPSGETAKKALDAYGEERYVERLNGLKQAYAERVSKLIGTLEYKGMSPETQKKVIDKIRNDEIIRPLKDDFSDNPQIRRRKEIDTFVQDLRDEFNIPKLSKGPVTEAVQKAILEQMQYGGIQREDKPEIMERLRQGEYAYKIAKAKSADDAIAAFESGISEAKTDDERKHLVRRLRVKMNAAKSQDSKDKYRMAIQKAGVKF